MKKKLTLRLDEDLIDRAKREAKKRGKSVSQMVADFFKVLEGESSDEHKKDALTPFTRSLIGSVKDVDEEDYYRYLEKKHE